MRTVTAGFTLLSALLASSAVWAQDAAVRNPTLVGPAPGLAVPTPRRWDHRYQITLRAGLAEGYSFIVRYHDGAGVDPCSLDDSKKFCVGLSTLMLDTALGFGVTQGLELEARMRLGVLTNFDDTRPLQVGLGLRTLSDPTGPLKFVLAAAVFADITSRTPRAGGDLDLIVRAEEGMQYDASRWFGFYVSAGESFGIFRNFSCVIDLNAGVQFRAPP